MERNMKKIDFYFDFGSPYSYLAYYQLQKIAQAHQAEIVYHPIILGGIFKATQNNSPAMVPAKAKYLFKDVVDWAKYWEIPFKFNPYFPINTFMPMRAAIGYQQRYPEQFQHYVATMFKAMFDHAVNLNDEHILHQTLEDAGLSVETYQTLIQDEQIKQLAKDKTQQAVERGLFGVPAFFVEGEMFWGQDRLNFVEQRLQSSS